MPDIQITETLYFSEKPTTGELTPRDVSVSETIGFWLVPALTFPQCVTGDVAASLPVVTLETEVAFGGVGELNQELNVWYLIVSTSTGYGDEVTWVDISFPCLTLTSETLYGMAIEGLIDLPPPTLEAEGPTGFVGEVGLVTIDSEGVEWGFPVELPMFTILSGDESTICVLPMFTLAVTTVTGGYTEVEISLPSITIESEALHNAIGELEVSLPRITLSATTETQYLGTAETALPSLTLTSDGTTGILGTAEFDLPVLTLSSTAIPIGIEADASMNLPMLVIEASGAPALEDQTVQNVIVMNLSHKSYPITEYTNHNFTGYMILDGEIYGVKADGIYKLGGDLDVTDEIEIEIEKTGIDLNTPLLKRATDLWMTFRAEGDILFNLISDNKSKEKIINNGIEGLRTQKLDLGKGLKGRFFGFNVKNIKGARIRLNQVWMMLDLLKRRAHDA